MYLFNLISLWLVLGPTAMASFSPTRLVDASRSALETFTKAFPGHVEAITGLKTWRSEEAAKVTLYMDHGGSTMEVTYLCRENTTTIDCKVEE